MSGEPFSEKTNPAFKASVMGFIDSVDTMIIGANTYAQTKGYWPYADDQGEYGQKLWGSLKLMHSLLDAGVVDEVRMLVCPVSRGNGTRIFEDRQDLKPIEATSFENGVVLLRYAIKK